MENYQYNVFKTRWGWFGLVGNEYGLVRTCLPMPDKKSVEQQLLTDFPSAKPSKTAFSALKNKIVNYYQGRDADFSNVTVSLEGLTRFQNRVLTTLKNVKYGQKVSYGQLARLSGNPKAARAIGTVMAKNPMPLIIPCHRVIKADGKIGQFSAFGGKSTKKHMLELEKQES